MDRLVPQKPWFQRSAEPARTPWHAESDLPIRSILMLTVCPQLFVARVVVPQKPVLVVWMQLEWPPVWASACVGDTTALLSRSPITSAKAVAAFRIGFGVRLPSWVSVAGCSSVSVLFFIVLFLRWLVCLLGRRLRRFCWKKSEIFWMTSVSGWATNL